MQIDHRFQTLERVRNVPERFDDIGLRQIQAVIEHRIEQTLFARNVVIEASLGEPSGCGHIAHRSIVIALAVKDLCRHLEYAVPREIAVSAALFLPLFTHQNVTYRPIGRLTLVCRVSQWETGIATKGTKVTKKTCEKNYVPFVAIPLRCFAGNEDQYLACGAVARGNGPVDGAGMPIAVGGFAGEEQCLGD